MNLCPVCLAESNKEAFCPHCGADVRLLSQMRLMEKIADQRTSLTNFQEIRRVYGRLGFPSAEGRVLFKLAQTCLAQGVWREARAALEQIFALNPKLVTDHFRREARRTLGGLLGRFGELPLAMHLLTLNEEEGDTLATLEKLRLELDQHRRQEALAHLATLEEGTNVSPLFVAWRLETLVRFGLLKEEAPLLAALGHSPADSPAYPILKRAQGLWLARNGRLEAALNALQEAIGAFFKLGERYETARAQVDLAGAFLISEFDARLPAEPISGVERARALLGKAATTFRKLGTPMAYQNALELGRSLSIGRAPSLHASLVETPYVPCAVVWVSLEGGWSAGAASSIAETIHRQGGSAQRLLEGWAGLFVLSSHIQPPVESAIPIETALALYDHLTHHQKSAPDDNSGKFRILAGYGLLPFYEEDLTHTLRMLPRQKVLHDLRAQAHRFAASSVWLSPQLAPFAHERYTLEAEQDHWRQLAAPQAKASKPPAPTLSQLTPPPQLRPRLEGFAHKNRGAFVLLTGVAGTGKTRLLEASLNSLSVGFRPWQIHIRGRRSQSDQPFHAIRTWLGSDLPTDSLPPEERRWSYLATFRRSVLGLLASKPLLLIVDDAHLLDNASLDTLQTVLPLVLTHRLFLWMTARPDEGNPRWQSFWATLNSIAPMDCLRIDLPDSRRYVARPLPENPQERHVLACAAVLGDRFHSLVLRRMASAPTLEAILARLKMGGWLLPSEEAGGWRWQESAERDAVYAGLAPGYVALLHWYARQALKAYGLPADHHAYPSGLYEPALKMSLRSAQNALEVDAAAEAAVHFGRALAYLNGSEAGTEIRLTYASALLGLGDLTRAQELLSQVARQPNLEDRHRVSQLILQGELHYRVGEVAALFKMYEEAAALLSRLPAEEQDPEERISLLYAQALARFKRGEVEMARSIAGAALALADKSQSLSLHAQLWGLLSQAHAAKNEIPLALKSATKSLALYRQAKSQFGLVRPLEQQGKLLLQSGQLGAAWQALSDALNLAEAIGDMSAALALHQHLATIALYQGEFGKHTHHLQAATHCAAFLGNESQRLETQALYAEGLSYEGLLFAALEQATLARHRAESLGEVGVLTPIKLALARVSLGLKQSAQAESFLAGGTPSSQAEIRLKAEALRLEIALERADKEGFLAVWLGLKQAKGKEQDEYPFWRGRAHLLAGRFYTTQNSWNDAAREYETASRLFARLGARYWQNQSQSALHAIAPQAPHYQGKTITSLLPALDNEALTPSPH